jgi:hypothetical protein
MSALGLVSRAMPVHTAMRNSTRDEGGPFGFGDQEPISSHRIGSIPPPRHQPPALIGRNLIFLDRARDSCLFIRRIVDGPTNVAGVPLM